MAKSILVVDDEKTIREVLHQYLEREGFKVLEAGDGYTVFDILEENDPDLILLDLMLPGIDGLTRLNVQEWIRCLSKSTSRLSEETWNRR